MHIDPKTTAVIPVHMERDVIEPDRAFGAMFAETVTNGRVLENLGTLLAAARDGGATVVFPCVAFPDDYAGVDQGIALLAAVVDANVLRAGTDGVDVVPQLGPLDTDVTFEHTGTSAFIGGRLERELGDRGITTVLVAGVATNVAVEGTARDASNRGYTTYVVSDCCAAGDDAAHHAALASLGLVTHGVVTSDDAVAALRSATADQPA